MYSIRWRNSGSTPSCGLCSPSLRLTRLRPKVTTIRVAVTLSKALPVALRVTYALSGTATPEDYSGLSPSPDAGLLFPAGETRKEVTLPSRRKPAGKARPSS